ncbi:DNA oxidative demethylase AlkB [Pseudokordiimonas caeni]|uniref:DNA oxidative demethylase AlkB n=1 Tax=Pseudokordiimonas caeni TaxID=2997908 RepID=UPI002810B94E|nr:DNA oxidative demethylase AlkB [Pseudokordiimonas caeni]
MADLFAALRPAREVIREGVVLLAGFADSDVLLDAVAPLVAAAPFRHMTTPGGRQMQVAMTNCGALGWVSEPAGYRYSPNDPLSGKPWPAMPAVMANLAACAAGAAGFDAFEPDVCLINRYVPGTRLSPHIDQDEADKSWPIVSVSLGIPATFQLYGNVRGGTPTEIPLYDGDVLVFGGPARHAYHGVKKLAPGFHARTGEMRINLTFRRAR